MVRHSHQDAIGTEQFERIAQAVEEFDEPQRTESRLILYSAGRLGLRAGEITHMRESWVDWDRGLIEIPAHQDCEKGRHGQACGYCRAQARQSVEKTGISYDEAISRMWSPKTRAASRAVPFDFDADVEAALETFFMFHDRYPKSRSSINRRVTEMAEAVGMDTDDLYPHALRATAGTYHSYRGLPAPALQSLMGWSRLEVAQKYIRLSGGQTQEALKQTHQS